MKYLITNKYFYKRYKQICYALKFIFLCDKFILFYYYHYYFVIDKYENFVSILYLKYDFFKVNYI